MPTPTLHYTRSTPSSPLQKAAADRFKIDLSDPLRHNPAATPSPHPSSPVANPPLFSDPKVAHALLVDYVAGLTASRLCSNYNISLPQLFAWRRSPETQAMLAEHEEFAAAQTRQVQHDKEPEIILTLCAIATRGSSESESRRAASDLLRVFKFRDYLAHRRPRNLTSQSDNQPSDTSSVPSDPSDLSIPRSTTPRPPRAYTPPIPSLLRRGDSPIQSRAQCSSRATCSPHFPKGLVPQTASRAMLATTPDASQPESLPESSRGSLRPAVHPRCTLAELPHAESVQPSALDREAQIGALDHLAAHGNTRAQSSDEIDDQALDLDDEERLEAELDQDELEAAADDEADENVSSDYDDDEDDEGEDEGEDEYSPKSAIPNPKSEMPSHSAIPNALCLIPAASPLEQQLLTLPAEVPSFPPKKPDPAPGFPFCLAPKPSGTAPSFEEMARFMPPPSKSFNPFWPESDILYLCYPGRTDKHNLRSAIVSHKEMLARSGAQALVDRNHFPPDQQSHQAYVAAEDFYKQLARKTPPPDH